MTEEEAKTNICHRTLNPVAIQTAANVGGAYGLSVDPQPCIGSACMAWRWEIDGEPKPFRVSPEIANDPKYYPGWPRLMTAPDERGWVEIAPVPPTDGFCGLAGKP